MNSPGAWIYILHGEDTFSRDEQLRALKERMRKLPAGEHNLAVLEGSEATLAALRGAADAAPFLADRRMVVIRGLLSRLLGGRGRRAPATRSARGKARGGEPSSAAVAAEELAALLAYLPGVPPTTSIVFVEDGGLDLAAVSGAIPAGRALITAYPRVDDVQTWVRRRARTLGVDLDVSAVRALADLGGDDLRRLDNEIRKLGAYCHGRTATREDVHAIVVGHDILVWGLLDALAERRRDRALSNLRTLYAQGETAEALLGRDIAPLYRRLLVAREYGQLDRVQRAAVDPGSLGLNPRTLHRNQELARGFAEGELDRALDLLLEMDRQVKTGETVPEVALEVVVARLCGRLADDVAA